jgi:hypothetical protein
VNLRQAAQTASKCQRGVTATTSPAVRTGRRESHMVGRMGPSSRERKMITVVEMVVGLLIYTAIAKWRKKQEEKQEDQEYAAELSRNWERHPGMYSY